MRTSSRSSSFSAIGEYVATLGSSSFFFLFEKLGRIASRVGKNSRVFWARIGFVREGMVEDLT